MIHLSSRPDNTALHPEFFRKTNVNSAVSGGLDMGPSMMNLPPTFLHPTVQMISQISSSIKVQYKIKFFKEHSVSCSGALLWRNGQKVKIQQAFQENILKTINRTGKSTIFFYFSIESEELRVKSKQRNLRMSCYKQYAQGMVERVNNKISDSLCVIQSFIGGSLRNHARGGPKATIFATKLKMKSHFLRAYRESVKILTVPQQKTCSMKDTLDKLGEQNALPLQYSSNLKYYQKIRQTQELRDDNFQTILPQSTKFKVQTKVCQLIEQSSLDGHQKVSEEEIQRVLAIKKVNSQLSGKSHCKRVKQLNRQIKIITKIEHQRHFFIDYSLPVTPDQTGDCPCQELMHERLYMENVPDTLSFHIRNNLPSLTEKLHLFRCIVEGVKALHDSGIVHRDLKPENILLPDLSTEGPNPLSSIKIIDFSDSSLISQPYSAATSNVLGCTIPYSPFQCNYIGEMGVKNPKIDVWSLGVVLFEMIYGTLPAIEIKVWMQLQNGYLLDELRDGIRKNQFSFVPYHSMIRTGSSLPAAMQKIMALLLCKLIAFRQEDRLELNKVLCIAQQMEHFLICVDTIS